MVQIDAAAQLAAIIRGQVGALRRRDNTRAGSASGETAKRDASPAPSPSGANNDLTEVFARRVLAIDPHDTQRERKAFRVFLESVLLAEFCPTLMNDAGFHQLVDQVQQQMELDPELSASIHDAATLLLASVPGNSSVSG